MKQKIRAASLWFTVLSLAASALNFLYYPIIARFLNLPQYGDVQIGVSFVMQAAALFSSLNLVALFLSANQKNTDNLTQRLERILIIPSFIGAVLLVSFAVPISQALQLHDPSLLYLLAVIFILNIPASTWVGTLQGEGSFVRSGAIAVAGSATKIIASIIFIGLGFGAYGAILGILLGTAAIVPLCYWSQKSNQLNFTQTFRLANTKDFAFITKNKSVIYILSTFILFSLVSTLDILFAKIHLSPADAGLFAQLSIIAKIPYFAFLPISIILFSRFIKEPRNQAKIYTLFCLAVATASTLVYLLLPLITKILFSIDLNESTKIITLFLLVAFGAFTILGLSIYLLVSRGRYLVAFSLAALAFLVAIVALLLANDSFELARNYSVTLTMLMLLSFNALRYNRKNVE